MWALFSNLQRDSAPTVPGVDILKAIEAASSMAWQWARHLERIFHCRQAATPRRACCRIDGMSADLRLQHTLAVAVVATACLILMRAAAMSAVRLHGGWQGPLSPGMLSFMLAVARAFPLRA